MFSISAGQDLPRSAREAWTHDRVAGHRGKDIARPHTVTHGNRFAPPSGRTAMNIVPQAQSTSRNTAVSRGVRFAQQPARNPGASRGVRFPQQPARHTGVSRGFRFAQQPARNTGVSRGFRFAQPAGNTGISRGVRFVQQPARNPGVSRGVRIAQQTTRNTSVSRGIRSAELPTRPLVKDQGNRQTVQSQANSAGAMQLKGCVTPYPQSFSGTQHNMHPGHFSVTQASRRGSPAPSHTFTATQPSRTPPMASRPTHPYFTSSKSVGRKWEDVPRKPHHRHGSRSFRFKIISYNVLADDLLFSNSFLYRSQENWLLEWEYRKKNLLQELRHYDADVSKLSLPMLCFSVQIKHKLCKNMNSVQQQCECHH